MVKLHLSAALLSYVLADLDADLGLNLDCSGDHAHLNLGKPK